MVISLRVGQQRDRDELLKKLVEILTSATTCL
jgi:hypothetical protein